MTELRPTIEQLEKVKREAAERSLHWLRTERFDYGAALCSLHVLRVMAGAAARMRRKEVQRNPLGRLFDWLRHRIY